MNWDRVEGGWKKAQQQPYGKLTNDDRNLVEGKRTELIGRIQARDGVERDEAERQIDGPFAKPRLRRPAWTGGRAGARTA